MLALSAAAEERVFDFRTFALNERPAGFRSAVMGQGQPGDWKVIPEEGATNGVAAGQEPSAKRAVLAQLAQDPTDEHFPLLIYEDEIFADFRVTTKFKTVRGTAEQMAGIAFRIQNETNYYVVRASSLGNTFRFYKVVEGERGTLIGPEMRITSGVWHELSVECKGNQIRCCLDGEEAIPPLQDSSFASGRIGFWTKSDSVSYFGDTRIVYTPREVPGRALVREMAKKYPRLLGLQLYVGVTGTNQTRLLASKNEAEVGKAGGKVERDVLDKGTIYYGKEKESASVVLPLRDRNGEPIGAVRVVMKSFPGELEQTAIVRATPIVKAMQARVKSLDDLL